MGHFFFYLKTYGSTTKGKVEPVSRFQPVKHLPKLELHHITKLEGSRMRNSGRSQNKHLFSAAIQHALDKAEIKLLLK